MGRGRGHPGQPLTPPGQAAPDIGGSDRPARFQAAALRIGCTFVRRAWWLELEAASTSYYSKTPPRLQCAVTEGTVGWATFGCGAGNFGVRGQAKRDPALAPSARTS